MWHRHRTGSSSMLLCLVWLLSPIWTSPLSLLKSLSMRRIRKRHLTHGEVGIQLSKQEIATFQRASAIAEEVRERARQINPDFEDDGLDLMLAGIEHPIHQDFRDGFIPVIETSDTLELRL